MNNLYDSFYIDEPVSRWEQSTSWSDYFYLLYTDASVYIEENFSSDQIKEATIYLLDSFSIKISVSCCCLFLCLPSMLNYSSLAIALVAYAHRD